MTSDEENAPAQSISNIRLTKKKPSINERNLIRNRLKDNFPSLDDNHKQSCNSKVISQTGHKEIHEPDQSEESLIEQSSDAPEQCQDIPASSPKNEININDELKEEEELEERKKCDLALAKLFEKVTSISKKKQRMKIACFNLHPYLNKNVSRRSDGKFEDMTAAQMYDADELKREILKRVSPEMYRELSWYSKNLNVHNQGKSHETNLVEQPKKSVEMRNGKLKKTQVEIKKLKSKNENVKSPAALEFTRQVKNTMELNASKRYLELETIYGDSEIDVESYDGEYDDY